MALLLTQLLRGRSVKHGVDVGAKRKGVGREPAARHAVQPFLRPIDVEEIVVKGNHMANWSAVKGNRLERPTRRTTGLNASDVFFLRIRRVPGRHRGRPTNPHWLDPGHSSLLPTSDAGARDRQALNDEQPTLAPRAAAWPG